MPSPGEDYQSWSVTAANNGSADPLINWIEGQTRASVNNSSRSELASHAKNRNLLNGSIVTTGTANAQAFLSGVSYTTIPTGLVIKLKIGPGLTNTASTTLNMDGIGAVLIQTASGDALRGGELVGGSYTDFIYNGTNWIFLYSREFFFDLMTGGGGIVLGVQTFKTPGIFTYTPTPGMECCSIECIGGGGAGGVGLNDGPAAFLCQGGGGGSGGYSRKLATAATIGTSQSVTVGAGGASNSASGSPSSVGTLCVANGGGGGPNNNYTSFGGGGAGGAPGTGDIAAAGAPGEGGTYLLFTPSGQQFDCSTGGGGSSVFGGGATPTLVGYTGGPNNGLAASNYGSGGGGGASGLYGAFGNGGAGSGGIVIITEFAGRGSPGRDGANGAVGPIGPTGPSGPGTGDVLHSGTPSNGQIARWTDASHIQGVSLSSLGLPVPLNLRKFTASGTYPAVTNGTVSVLCYCKSGGGSGASTSSAIRNGGGGGEGEEAWALTTAALLSGVTITVGAGGTANPAGNGANGNAGAASAIGALVSCGGGNGGAAGHNGGAGGVGGSGGSGTALGWRMAGAVGQPGADITAGTVGLPAAGGGKGAGIFATNALANSGGGGGGGSTAAPSGAGGSGIVVFIEFGTI